MELKNRIIEDLKSLGVKRGDKLIVHASFKSFGYSNLTMCEVIDALKEAVGSEGTLMFPTFTYDYVNELSPVFDVRTTRSCVGAMPEYFRKCDGVIRSIHPTHSVAVWGNNKEWYVENHHKDQVAVGNNSPLIKLKDTGGKILMIGCGITHNTLIHGVEDFIRPPYVYNIDYSLPKYHREFVCIDENDNIYRQEFFVAFACVYDYIQRFDRLRFLMPIQKGKILKAESYIMNAKDVWDVAVEKMKEDPFYFVEYENKPTKLY